jgi:hypothetical protein
MARHAKTGGQLRRSDIWFGISVPSSASPSMPLLMELIPCVTVLLSIFRSDGARHRSFLGRFDRLVTC